MNTRKITSLSILIAINVVLSILAPIKLANMRFTFEAFPILIGAIIAGPTDGMIIGTLGSLIYQIFFSGYGLMITTPLWILPHTISGVIVGYYSKKHNFLLKQKESIFICITSSLIVTIFNTLAIYVDSKIFGYYTFAYVFGTIFLKIIAGVLLAILYSLTIPKIVKRL